jgi:DNA-binding NtrC family response regulator
LSKTGNAPGINYPPDESEIASRKFAPSNTGAPIEAILEDIIRQAMEKANNNMRAAAKLLHMRYDSLRYRKYNNNIKLIW